MFSLILSIILSINHLILYNSLELKTIIDLLTALRALNNKIHSKIIQLLLNVLM